MKGWMELEILLFDVLFILLFIIIINFCPAICFFSFHLPENRVEHWKISIIPSSINWWSRRANFSCSYIDWSYSYIIHDVGGTCSSVTEYFDISPLRFFDDIKLGKVRCSHNRVRSNFLKSVFLFLAWSENSICNFSSDVDESIRKHYWVAN